VAFFGPERIESRELFVHFDPDGLEDAADGMFALFARDALELGVDRGGKSGRGGENLPGEDGCEQLCVGFVRDFNKNAIEFVCGN